jgi:hypothetical protein
MGADRPILIETMIDTEIRRLVAEAASNGGCICAPVAAAQIRRDYPDCASDERQLADRIMMAATAAGLAVEIGKPADMSGPRSA